MPEKASFRWRSIETLRVGENCVRASFGDLKVEEGQVDLRLAKVLRGSDEIEAVAQTVRVAVARSVVDPLIEINRTIMQGLQGNAG